MNEAFFLYWEEAEWALRFRANGFDVAVDPSAEALHESGHSTGGPGSPIFEYYMARNLLLLVRGGRDTGKIASLFLAAGFLLRRILESARRRDPALACATTWWILVGIVDFLRGRTGMRVSLHTGRPVARETLP